MTMTDPIADMLTRLRNANQAYHDQVTMPYSKIKANIAEVLKAEGYIASWAVEEPEEGAVGKKPGRRTEVRPEPGAQPRRHPARLQARPAGLRQVRRSCRGCSVASAWRSFRRPRDC